MEWVRTESRIPSSVAGSDVQCGPDRFYETQPEILLEFLGVVELPEYKILDFLVVGTNKKAHLLKLM